MCLQLSERFFLTHNVLAKGLISLEIGCLLPVSPSHAQELQLR